MTENSQQDEQAIFVEQAEYISEDEFTEWTIEHPDESLILQKLSSPGAKLLTGPRGSGKTTLLLKTYNTLIASPQKPLPIYVNFKVSLKLEPLYKTSSNALYWFSQWVLLMMYTGLYETITRLEFSAPSLSVSEAKARLIKGKLEVGDTDVDGLELTAPRFLADVDKTLTSLGRKRCVLLLDDAAHAFSTEQQRDFFEIFRQLRTRRISPKAAVYPGVTMYSPSFHVGHDAEEIDIWLNPYSPRYISFMKDVLRLRLPEQAYNLLAEKTDHLDLICLSAFGSPRALLNMVRSLGDSGEGGLRLARQNTLDAIRENFEQSMNIFTSLRRQLPIYQHFIDAGERIFDEAVESIAKYNRTSQGPQSVTLAIQTPIPPELINVIGFFQYSGLMMQDGSLKKGKEKYDRYLVHSAALVSNNAIVAERSVSIPAYTEALRVRSSHAFTRIVPSKLVGSDNIEEALPLALPPCTECGTKRISPDARFCMHCGAPLKSQSVFEALVAHPIEILCETGKLTEGRIAAIRRDSGIATIKDILLDHEHTELRKVKMVGQIWASRIYRYAEELLG